MSLKEALCRSTTACNDEFAAWGCFVAELHTTASRKPELREEARALVNRNVQEVRLLQQYSPSAERWRELLGPASADRINGAGRSLEAMGTRFAEVEGVCWTHGDCWPPSVLCRSDGCWLIDWEFTHWGRMAQDLGHVAAHVWLSGLTEESMVPTEKTVSIWKAFWMSYVRALDADEDLATLFDKEAQADCMRHMGAEVLGRVSGEFSAWTADDARGKCRVGAEAALALVEAGDAVARGERPGCDPWILEWWEPLCLLGRDGD